MSHKSQITNQKSRNLEPQAGSAITDKSTPKSLKTLHGVLDSFRTRLETVARATYCTAPRVASYRLLAQMKERVAQLLAVHLGYIDTLSSLLEQEQVWHTHSSFFLSLSVCLRTVHLFFLSFHFCLRVIH